MCMHWLKYLRLNRKDRLKIMRGTTLEVAMLADVRAGLMFANVWLSSSGMSLRHSLWKSWTLIGQQNFNGAALDSCRFVVDFELRCQSRYFVLYESTVHLMDTRLSQYMS